MRFKKSCSYFFAMLLNFLMFAPVTTPVFAAKKKSSSSYDWNLNTSGNADLAKEKSYIKLLKILFHIVQAVGIMITIFGVIKLILAFVHSSPEKKVEAAAMIAVGLGLTVISGLLKASGFMH